MTICPPPPPEAIEIIRKPLCIWYWENKFDDFNVSVIYFLPPGPVDYVS